MQTFDFVMLVIMYTQPMVFATLLFGVAWPKLIGGALGLQNLGVRQRLRSTRFFECAAYSRLIGWLRYNTQGLALCGLFLLYDIDLVFFFSEVTTFENWTSGQLALFSAYVGFFIGGLYYDLWRYGLLWGF